MIYVLGSGPASISATQALLKQGKEVTIIDPGKELEPDRQSIIKRLSSQKYEEWSEEDVNAMKCPDFKTHGKIHDKLNYGSSYPYEGAGESFLADRSKSPFHYSMAKGGLSSVWGASLSPYADKDIIDWPISVQDLEEHYRAVLDFIPSTGETDDLDSLLPLYTDRSMNLDSSSQAKDLLRNMDLRKSSLQEKGIFHGHARHALDADGKASSESCAYCGLCLYGCPYSLLYSTAGTLADLIQSDKVKYVSGHYVEKLVQRDGRIDIVSRKNHSGEEVVFEADRVFVGCGVLPTAYIMLNSLEHYNQPVTLPDSQYFIYPFLSFRRSQGIMEERLHSVAQLFWEIDDPLLSDNLVHIEVFGYSEFVKDAMMKTAIGPLLKSRFLSKNLFERLLVLQCFLHSNDSSSLTLTLNNAGGNSMPHLTVHPRRKWKSFRKSVQTGFKLAASSFDVGGVPLLPALQFSDPGRSYHSGGSFPMKTNPGRLETDIYGRFSEMERVHLIDSSVFTTVPATTVTFTVMANAHRIASQINKF